jgi:putative hydrolase of the HAD superfamily
MNLVLDPQTVTAMIEPVKSTVQLILKLKEAGHSVYCCGNAPEELYITAQQKFPDIIGHFDGIVISSHIKAVKPDESIFKYLLKTHNLNSANCIVIEDQEESAVTATRLGMQAIVCDKPSHLASKLKKRGVRI